MNTHPPPLGNHNTSLSQSPVLLAPGNTGDFVEVTAQCSCQMMTRLSTVPPPFVTIPPATVTSFPSDFGYLDSEYDATTPPDNKVQLNTVGVTAPWAHPDMIGNVGPMAAFSLQALLDNSFESIFGAASSYGTVDALM